ncbi:unnamed protein product [Lactuca saligna]|uniref:PGG domain-containing protein n=1 Tax=Lactuca saligna TaxID=75948 RepID=A0AA35ZIG0_LACSI|nr:unnamed protein product [Lactuca saligna]
MANSSYSSNPHVTLEVGEECPYPYPYPWHVYTPSFVSLKLSGKNEYIMWKKQMLCLLESHDMFGFIDGTLISPDEASSSSSVSGKGKVGDRQTYHKLWKRSDALVKGWILGSLSNETLRYVVNCLAGKHHQDDFSAKDVWDELQTMYAPHVLPEVQHVVEDTLQDQDRADDIKRLYEYTEVGYWYGVEGILREGRVTVVDKITNKGNTTLHVAVDGSTLLHVAAIIGNTEAADNLVARNHELLLAKDNKGQTPLDLAFSHMHTETARQLLQHIKTDIQKDALFSGATGDELLGTVISSKDFCLAADLIRHYRNLHGNTALMAIAENFPCELSVLARYIVGADEIRDRLRLFVVRTTMDCIARCLPSLVPWVNPMFKAFFYVICWSDMLFRTILYMLVSPFIKKSIKNNEDAIKLLNYVCDLIVDSNHSSSYHHCYTKPILEATRLNAHQVVHIIWLHFPNATLSANEDGHNIFQYAVIHRSEKVYNFLYQMTGHRKNIYRTIKDFHGNNLLHLAARLAPTDKLNRISGAALQIQRELQWFKEVEGFVYQLSITQKNSSGETPQMVFTREHKDLVIDGEKWMKSTAGSYTITAALIITVVFAGAITVPGGSDQNAGIPIFTNSTAFKIFAISDAISLFAAVTSLLMFLSILTARFAEQDFLYKLPTKLIIGLATLFISTTAMIVAFSATLYLVFGQSNSRILIPIAVLTCLPITSFVTLQFPLVLDLISATYGSSIFGKKRYYRFILLE